MVFNCAAFHNVDVCEAERRAARGEVNVEAVRELALAQPAAWSTSRPTTSSTGAVPAPYAEDDLPTPRSVYALTKLAGEYAALAYASRALVVRTGGLYGMHGSASKGGNFVQRMIARARASGPGPPSCGWSPTSGCSRPSPPTWPRRSSRPSRPAPRGSSISRRRAPARGIEFTEAIMQRAGLDVPVEPVSTTIAPGGADRPLNGVLARPRADALGLPALRPWDEALTDYMDRAGLAVQAALTN